MKANQAGVRRSNLYLSCEVGQCSAAQPQDDDMQVNHSKETNNPQQQKLVHRSSRPSCVQLREDSRNMSLSQTSPISINFDNSDYCSMETGIPLERNDQTESRAAGQRVAKNFRQNSTASAHSSSCSFATCPTTPPMKQNQKSRDPCLSASS